MKMGIVIPSVAMVFALGTAEVSANAAPFYPNCAVKAVQARRDGKWMGLYESEMECRTYEIAYCEMINGYTSLPTAKSRY